ncbi:hypothetical protein AX17_001842 [Amanita inopinata Kibby_2008]|nr:hypothetical protein AX17_001842 [Amanita inopinata Kibby_2008]
MFTLEDTLLDPSLAEELVKVKNELHLLKANNPFRVVEMAIELQKERTRAAEALQARDVAVLRLSEAYTLLRRKGDQSEPTASGDSLNVLSVIQKDVNYMGAAIKMLREETQTTKDSVSITAKSDLEPRNEFISGKANIKIAASVVGLDVKSDAEVESRIIYATKGSDEPSEMMHARHAVLATIPVPPDAPEDTLKPIVIPPPFTFSEFINSLTGVSVKHLMHFYVELVQHLRSFLPNYRVLHGLTTVWCPEREEHGYFYAPRFKCNTNPRVATAHRWSQADVVSPMSKPTECFFNKDGAWYYAGIYKVFAMDDLTVKEWADLSPETTQAIIKETLSGRKNTSPQNVYETGQLYAAGALKVACVGLQCVGFNQVMYKGILEHASRFAQCKLKTPSSHGIVPVGNASPRTHWSASCKSPKEVADGLGSLSLEGHTQKSCQ